MKSNLKNKSNTSTNTMRRINHLNKGTLRLIYDDYKLTCEKL